MNFVIIGNGVAGINAANTIRNRHVDASITLISSEHDHFFSRTALMYVFCGQLSDHCVEPYERNYYELMRFQRIKDRVVRLDASSSLLHLASGKTVPYDRLLIASGSVGLPSPWPGSDLQGVGHFVTWQNLEWLQGEAKKARRAVVVGGGLIGIEAAEVLIKAGIQTSFLIRESTFWPIALSPAESDLIIGHMRSHHCDVRQETEIQEIVGANGHITGIRTRKDELIETDLLVVAIGVTPQTAFLASSGIELDSRGGIVVDDQLRTNLPHVYAAGDCTSVVWFNGIRRPEQLWYTSRDQGRTAGANMSGDNRPYKRATFYNSAKLFDIEYTTAGLVNFNLPGEVNWYREDARHMFTERITYLPDHTVAGFNMLGRRWDHRVLVRWIDQKRPIDWVLPRLHEALFDEEFMPAFARPQLSELGR